MKAVLLLAMVAAALLVAGCAEPQGQKKTEGQDASNKEQRSALNQENKESALAAARTYYKAAARGNYDYTYDALASDAQGQFSKEDWAKANTALGSDAARYDVHSAKMVDDATAEVNLTVILPDGTSENRVTLFVYESGDWKHQLTAPEYDLFAIGAQRAAATSGEATTEPPAETSDEEPTPYIEPTTTTPPTASAITADPGKTGLPLGETVTIDAPTGGTLEVTLEDAFATRGDPDFDTRQLGPDEVFVVCRVHQVDHTPQDVGTTGLEGPWFPYNNQGIGRPVSLLYRQMYAEGRDRYLEGVQAWGDRVLGVERPARDVHGTVAFIAHKDEVVSLGYQPYEASPEVSWDIGPVSDLPRKPFTSRGIY